MEYMRIGDTYTPNYWQGQYTFPRQYAAAPQQAQGQAIGGVILDISPETFAASRLSASRLSPEQAGRGAAMEMQTECKTCESRRYQDVSDDSSVSFQSPTHISPGASASVVAAHEAEHVSNEQAKAFREGREIVSQTVSLYTSVCPECKTVYVSGGSTRTVTVGSADNAETPAAQAPTEEA